MNQSEEEDVALDEGTTLDEIDKDLFKMLGELERNKTKITDNLNVTTINRLEKTGATDDYCRDVDIRLDETQTLPDQFNELMTIMELSKAPGTKLIQNYSWRSWIGWLNEQKEKYSELTSVDPYNPDKHVVGLYLLHMRVIHKYSHSTVVQCFWNQLCSVLKEERGIDIKKDMKDFIHKLFRALVRKYGNSKFKVCPLLNTDLQKWQKILAQKDNREPQIKLRALIMFGRHTGWRGDTLSYMKLKHIHLSVVERGGHRYFVSQNVGFKNKGIGGHELRNTVYGSSDLNQCPIFALLWYLFHIRKVFVAKTLNDIIEHGNFKLKGGAEEEYLFTQSMSDQAMSAKDMSNLMKRSSAEVLKCRYSMRSLRSGHICQALLTCIMRYGIIKDSVRQAVKRHVGWNNDESIDAYERLSIFCSQNVANLQDLQQDSDAQELVRGLWGLNEQETPNMKESTPIRTTMRERRRSPHHPKKPAKSVTKFVSFRRIKKRILELNPKLKEACEEEDKIAAKLKQKSHQTIWTTYHQRYIKKWCENSVECLELLNQNNDYLHGTSDEKSSVLLNIGKRTFLQLAVNDKRDEYIRKVFYEDLVPKEIMDDSERGSVKRRFLPRNAKRKLDFTMEDPAEDDLNQTKRYKQIILPDFIKNSNTQPQTSDSQDGNEKNRLNDAFIDNMTDDEENGETIETDFDDDYNEDESESECTPIEKRICFDENSDQEEQEDNTSTVSTREKSIDNEPEDEANDAYDLNYLLSLDFSTM